MQSHHFESIRDRIVAVFRPIGAGPLQDHNAETLGSGGDLALIHAAERLFALHGIAGVSLRQITQESGHKNMSAANYHFGSREGLVRAVLTHRMPAINARRTELLARAAKDGRRPDLRSCIEAYVVPLAEQLQPRPEGNHYVRFLAEYRKWPADLETMRQLASASFAMTEHIAAALAYLPPRIVRLRYGHTRGMIVTALAEAEGQIGAGEMDPADIPLLAADLVDMIAASLTAPVSADVADALARSTSAAELRPARLMLDDGL